MFVVLLPHYNHNHRLKLTKGDVGNLSLGLKSISPSARESTCSFLNRQSQGGSVMGQEAALLTMGRDTTLVFTYGTLKKGFPNHVLLRRLMDSGDALFLGSCRTLHHYPLVCGPFRVPFLLHLPGSGHRVGGELYSVSPHALSLLDDLEGTSLGNYQRLPLLIDTGNGSPPTAAQAYFAGPSYASDMWKKTGKEASTDYTAVEAAGYVRRADRPANVSFLDHVRTFLSS